MTFGGADGSQLLPLSVVASMSEAPSAYLGVRWAKSLPFQEVLIKRQQLSMRMELCLQLIGGVFVNRQPNRGGELWLRGLRVVDESVEKPLAGSQGLDDGAVSNKNLALQQLGRVLELLPDGSEKPDLANQVVELGPRRQREFAWAEQNLSQTLTRSLISSSDQPNRPYDIGHQQNRVLTGVLEREVPQ